MISIVLATYNGKEFIIEQLKSIINQTYRQFEIIIVDDNSTDNTLEVINDFFYENKGINVKTIKNSTNIGVNKSFEKAIINANGEYIAFCDQDDIWFAEKLHKLYETQINTNKKMLSAPSLILKNSKATKKMFPKYHFSKNEFNLYLYNNARGATIFIEREYLLKLLPFSEYGIYDKWIYFLSIYFNEYQRIPFPLDYYRLHSKNQIGNSFNFSNKNTLINRFNYFQHFYKDMKAFISKDNSIYSSELNHIVESIIEFWDKLKKVLEKRKYLSAASLYIKYIIKNDFILKEKLLFFYYFFIR